MVNASIIAKATIFDFIVERDNISLYFLEKYAKQNPPARIMRFSKSK